VALLEEHAQALLEALADGPGPRQRPVEAPGRQDVLEQGGAIERAG
jgi:hypothetical protein